MAKKEVKPLSLTKQLNSFIEKTQNQAQYSQEALLELLEITSKGSNAFTALHASSLTTILTNYLVMLKGVSMTDISLDHVTILANFSNIKFTINGVNNIGLKSQAHQALINPIIQNIFKHFAENLSNLELSDNILSKIVPMGAQDTQIAMDNVNKFLCQDLKKSAKITFDIVKERLSKDELKKFFTRWILDAIHNKNIDTFKILVKDYGLNLHEFKFLKLEPELESKILSILDLVMVSDSYKFKQQYLEFLSSKKLQPGGKKVHPDSDIDHPLFQATQGITAFLRACLNQDKKLIELLMKHGADINLISYMPSTSGADLLPNDSSANLISKRQIALGHFTSPFKTSFETGNIDFVLYLVSKGANPLTAVYKGDDCTGNKTIKTQGFHSTLKQRLPSEEARNEFRNKYIAIIEKALIAEILAVQTNVISTVDSKPQLLAQKEIIKKEVAKEFTPEESKEAKLISTYIDFKQNYRDIKTIEDHVDLLILNHLKNPSPESLESLQTYIANHPELDYYPVTSLFKLGGANDDSIVILSSQPKLLHKFFAIKKQYIDHNDNSDAPNEYTIPKGVFAVKSDLKNNIYITISEEIEGQIPLKLFQEFTNQLSNCSFIKADSHRVSGIKTHNGLIRLKLAGKDISLSTNTRFIDKAGNLFINFDKVRSHKDPMGAKITTHAVESFSDLPIWHKFSQAEGDDATFDELSHHAFGVAESEVVGDAQESDAL